MDYPTSSLEEGNKYHTYFIENYADQAKHLLQTLGSNQPQRPPDDNIQHQREPVQLVTAASAVAATASTSEHLLTNRRTSDSNGPTTYSYGVVSNSFPNAINSAHPITHSMGSIGSIGSIGSVGSSISLPNGIPFSNWNTSRSQGSISPEISQAPSNRMVANDYSGGSTLPVAAVDMALGSSVSSSASAISSPRSNSFPEMFPPSNTARRGSISLDNTVYIGGVQNINSQGNQGSGNGDKTGRTCRSSKVSYYCNYCGKTYTRQNRLKKHILSKHGGKKFVFKCDICYKCYTSKENLNRHKNLHTEKYRCPRCGITHDRAKRFEKHLATCLPDKPPLL
ncbi:DEKNAAC100263 [Brettanomyces naardenensis]|uniref:DEKNAAC100263 n=1 Tax=Brettanomyces naardenensis TaxID=13370 RepID=A0A448YEW8_BRENA|nr:DEKNAAC100263 [Brettanomyces naardenensis]